MIGPKKNKKIVFDDTDIRHAKLKIRLQHDSLSQAEFFRAMVTGYLEKNSSILKYIKQYKEQYKKQSKVQIKKSQSDAEKGRIKMEQFGIVDALGPCSRLRGSDGGGREEGRKSRAPPLHPHPPTPTRHRNLPASRVAVVSVKEM